MTLWLALAFLSISPFQEAPQALSSSWAHWRGPLGNGSAPGADPPLVWSESENVRWKTALPGRGHSTPIVWENRVFVTAAVPVGPKLKPLPETAPGAHDNLRVTSEQEFVVLALDLETGEILWRTAVHRDLPHEGGHKTSTFASSSPCTDGERVYALFGSYGLYALDHSGTLIWKRDLGRMQTKHGHGEGSSPALHGETLIVNWDHEGPSFLVAIDTKTGKDRWRVERDEVTSWASPVIAMHEGKAQVIVSGTKRVRAYDLETGAVIWECSGLSHNVVASPVAADGVVIAASSYEKQALIAIDLKGARGDLTGTKHVLWQRNNRTPYVPSPLLHQGKLWFLNHYQGVMTRVDARTGDEQPGSFRLPGMTEIYASPVAAQDRIYVSDRFGVTLVLADENSPRVLSRNVLDDRFSTSAALVGDVLLLRGEEYLYCLGE
ncbi:MAG: PQQ-binding-like beta-propeller repeat protein [Planctomycetota bacterium]